MVLFISFVNQYVRTQVVNVLWLIKIRTYVFISFSRNIIQEYHAVRALGPNF